LPRDGDHDRGGDRRGAGPLKGRGASRHGPRRRRGPPASPPTALPDGSPGRTRTCNLVVTRAPAFPRGLDYLIPVGARWAPRRGRALPPPGGRAARGPHRGTTSRSSLCTVPRAAPARGLRSGFPYPAGDVGFPEFARFSIPPFGRDAAASTATCSTG